MNKPLDPIQKRKLPDCADYYLRQEVLSEYTNAMADILCWLGGFQAAGGIYSPSTFESLRSLSDALKSIEAGIATSNQSHKKQNQNP